MVYALGSVVQGWVGVVGSRGGICEASVDLLVCRDIARLTCSKCAGRRSVFHSVVCSASSRVGGTKLVNRYWGCDV